MTLLQNLLSDPWIWKYATYFFLTTNVVLLIAFFLVSNACNNLSESCRGLANYIENDKSAVLAKTAIENAEDQRGVNSDLVKLNKDLIEKNRNLIKENNEMRQDNIKLMAHINATRGS